MPAITAADFPEHFPLAELVESHTALRHGIDNTPAEELMGNLLRLAKCLMVVREALGNKPVRITSGYRCAELETMVGGTMTRANLEEVKATTRIDAVRLMADHRIWQGKYKNWGSSHSMGLAADIQVPGFGSPLEVCRRIEVIGLPFDQVIHEFGGWCHLGIGPGTRRQCLTIDNGGTRVGLMSCRA